MSLSRMLRTTADAWDVARCWRLLRGLYAVAVAMSLIVLTLGESPLTRATPIAAPPPLPVPEKQDYFEDYGHYLALSPDGVRLATAGQIGQGAYLFDLSKPRGEILTTIARDQSPASYVWSNDGKLFACGFSNAIVKEAAIPQGLLLYDGKTGKVVHDLLGHRSGIPCVVFSPDGKRLASASYDETVRLWDVATGKQLRVLKLGGEGTAVAFSPDGKQLASLSGLDKVQLWDAASGDLLKTADSMRVYLSWLAFHPKKPLIACAVNRRENYIPKCTVVLWEVRDGSRLVEVCTLKGPKDGIRRVAFHPDGRHVAACSVDGMAYIWDLKTKKRLHALNHGGRALDLSFSADGKRLGVATGHNITIWNFASRQED